MDGVPIFSEGTAEEQVQELVTYLARSLPEEERQKFIEPFQALLAGGSLADDEQRRQQIFNLILQHTQSLGPGSDREIEGFFNLLLSHVVALYKSQPDVLVAHIKHITDIELTADTPDNLPLLYRLLSNNFNMLPRSSPLRLYVFQALLKSTSANDLVQLLQLSEGVVDRWMQEWDVSDEEKSHFLMTIADALDRPGYQDLRYDFILKHLEILSRASQNAQAAAIVALSAALQIPTVLNFERLISMDSIQSLKGHPLCDLVSLYQTGEVADFLRWEESNPSVLAQYKLDRLSLIKKIRMLTLASLGSSNVGSQISYEAISRSLQIPEEEVDEVVIEVIHSGLVSGKLSQSQKTFYVSRSKLRSFSQDDWVTLEKRLLSWKGGLSSVLEVVQKMLPAAAAAAPTATTTTTGGAASAQSD